MAIGRDTIPIHMINTYTQFPASGGGYTAEININPISSSSGKSVQAAFPVNDGSGGTVFIDGNTNDGVGTLGTASSPTRTTQIMTLSRQDMIDANNASAHSAISLLIAGYINHNGDSASSFLWAMPSSIIVSSSLTGSSVGVFETHEDNSGNQDNSTFSTGTLTGIYSQFGVADSGSGYHKALLNYGGGRGGLTFPANGDTFTVRITASATVTKDGTAHANTTAIHDVIVNITS